MAKKRRSVDNTGRNDRNTSRYSERTRNEQIRLILSGVSGAGEHCVYVRGHTARYAAYELSCACCSNIVFSVVYCVYNTGCKEKTGNRREDFQPVDDLCADIRRLQHRSGE